MSGELTDKLIEDQDIEIERLRAELTAARKQERERCIAACEQCEVHDIGHPGTGFRVQHVLINAIRALEDE